MITDITATPSPTPAMRGPGGTKTDGPLRGVMRTDVEVEAEVVEEEAVGLGPNGNHGGCA